MTAEQRRAAALAQLTLVLGFFPRVESRLALVFGVNVSLLALLTTALPSYAQWDARMWVALLPLALIAASLLNIWSGMFPDVKGGQLENGQTSVVFFGTVAQRTEADFVTAFGTSTDESYSRDLLGQVWTNSRILSAKFSCLERAFSWLLAALVPWLVSMALLLAMNPNPNRLLP